MVFSPCTEEGKKKGRSFQQEPAAHGPRDFQLIPLFPPHCDEINLDTFLSVLLPQSFHQNLLQKMHVKSYCTQTPCRSDMYLSDMYQRECTSSRPMPVCLAAKHRDLKKVPYPNATMLNISKCTCWKPTPFNFQVPSELHSALPPQQDCVALSQQKL